MDSAEELAHYYAAQYFKLREARNQSARSWYQRNTLLARRRQMLRDMKSKGIVPKVETAQKLGCTLSDIRQCWDLIVQSATVKQQTRFRALEAALG